MSDERVRPWSAEKADARAAWLLNEHAGLPTYEPTRRDAETLRAYARLVRQQEQILLLLGRGRTDGGEVITSAKHAAEVIRRDILDEPETA